MERPGRSEDPATADLRGRLDAAHAGLLRVHKAILDHERSRFELARGTVGTPLAFLQLVLHDPHFAWLRPISELIVQIDELTASREPMARAGGETLLRQARELLTPNQSGEAFAREYYRAIQESPAVATAHGEWRRTTAAT